MRRRRLRGRVERAVRRLALVRLRRPWAGARWPYRVPVSRTPGGGGDRPIRRARPEGRLGALRAARLTDAPDALRELVRIDDGERGGETRAASPRVDGGGPPRRPALGESVRHPCRPGGGRLTDLVPLSRAVYRLVRPSRGARARPRT